MTVTPQLKAILLAGGLAALALVLGFMTLGMNQSSSSAAAPKPIMPLHVREKATGAKAPASKPAAKPKPKPDPNVTAAIAAGLPRSVATQLGMHDVVVVELYSAQDDVDELTRNEAAAGAALAHAGFVPVNVDKDGDAATLTKKLGNLPPAPATFIVIRPGDVFAMLPGFNDHTIVQQAATNADPGETLASTSAWATQASALCQTAVAKGNALGGFSADAQLLKAKPKFDAIMTDFLASMKALKPTPGTEAQVAQLNALLAQNYQLIDAMLLGMAKKDVVAVANAAGDQEQLSGKIQSLEHQLGATGCTELA